MDKQKQYWKCYNCTGDKDDACVIIVNYSDYNDGPTICPYGADAEPTWEEISNPMQRVE